MTTRTEGSLPLALAQANRSGARHLRERLTRRRKAAEAGLGAALEALAEAQLELNAAVAAQLSFENREHIVAQQRARKATYERARIARARRDATRDMQREGVL